MINDAEMLTYILQSAEMGCQGIKHVREGKCSRALDTVLCNQMARYGKIYSTAGSMLKNLGEDIHRISPLARKMAQLRDQILMSRLQNGIQQRLLAGKIPIEGPLADLRQLRDLIHRDLVIATRGEQFLSRLQYLVSFFFRLDSHLSSVLLFPSPVRLS